MEPSFSAMELWVFTVATNIMIMSRYSWQKEQIIRIKLCSGGLNKYALFHVTSKSSALNFWRFWFKLKHVKLALVGHFGQDTKWYDKINTIVLIQKQEFGLIGYANTLV